jgi:hypothetical protein
LRRRGRAVGWIALFSDCGPVGLGADGSYCPGTPLKLVVHENGRAHTYGDHVPIWKWAFLAGGEQVGYMQMTLHGSNEEYFQLRDVATGRLLATFIRDILDPKPDSPGWVHTVASKR